MSAPLIGISKLFCMDISLIKSEESSVISPTTIHGMLWLQTHFEDEFWEAISSQRVKISNEEASYLFQDAQSAGLEVAFIPTVVNSKNF